MNEPRIWKAMGRERRESWPHFLGERHIGDSVTCDECGGEVRSGDWPWCHGDPAAHERE